MKYFNEYGNIPIGMPNDVDAMCEEIEYSIVKFFTNNKDIDPMEMKAIAYEVIREVDTCFCENILIAQMKNRKTDIRQNNLLNDSHLDKVSDGD